MCRRKRGTVRPSGRPSSSGGGSASVSPAAGSFEPLEKVDRGAARPGPDLPAARLGLLVAAPAGIVRSARVGAQQQDVDAAIGVAGRGVDREGRRAGVARPVPRPLPGGGPGLDHRDDPVGHLLVQIRPSAVAARRLAVSSRRAHRRRRRPLLRGRHRRDRPAGTRRSGVVGPRAGIDRVTGRRRRHRRDRPHRLGRQDGRESGFELAPQVGQPAQDPQVVEVGRAVGGVEPGEIREDRRAVHPASGFLGVAPAGIARGVAVVVAGDRQRRVGVAPMEVARDGEQVAGAERDGHGQPARFMQACAGGVALAHQDRPRPRRVAEPVMAALDGALFQKPLAALGIQELQRKERAVAVAHRRHQQVPQLAQADGGDLFLDQIRVTGVHRRPRPRPTARRPARGRGPAAAVAPPGAGPGPPRSAPAPAAAARG